MSIIRQVLSGTYVDALTKAYPKYTENDFWALIFCGSDLNSPYSGWAGIAAVPVYSDAPEFELYFGDFSESLAQYENIPTCRIDYSCSRRKAFTEFRSFMSQVTSNPVFISANSRTWALPIIREAITNDVSGEWNAQLLCTRDVYSITHRHDEIGKEEFIGQAMNNAAPLPKRFGLHQIASTMGLSVPDSSNKAIHRARLTALVAKECLNKTYPSEGNDVV